MTKGGYQILDFSGYKFVDNQPQKVEGIADKFLSSDKPIMVSGLNISDNTLRNQFVSCLDSSTTGATQVTMRYNSADVDSYVLITIDIKGTKKDTVTITDNFF